MPSIEGKCEVDDSFDEAVVISGMSGLYPESHNVKDLSDILYNKINPVRKESTQRQYVHPEAIQYKGKVPDLALFDAQFFKVHYRLSNSMDAMGRKLIEHTYQAIYDSGISPDVLCGRKIGVYIGNCLSETEKVNFYFKISEGGFGLPGCSKAMFANRISYWLNVTGPSMSIDDACCSSTRALEQAYFAIKRGECEAAIVGGAHLCLHPQSLIHYNRIMKISSDGKTKSFDTEATGCAKSEAVNVLFLQKGKNALRVYAEIVHVKCEFTIIKDDLEAKYGFYRDPDNVAKFIRTFYEEAKVPPRFVEYVEAFGSAQPEADKGELEALDKVFCENNDKQLMVGSVMSNIGYTEAASGISAITKVLLGYHHGQLAGNLHCESPRQDVAGLRDGRMRILTDHQAFGRTYTAVNGVSITGVITHVLLNGHYKPKVISRYKSNIPYLVTISGRQESSVTKIFQDLKSRPIDAEELSLFHNIHTTSTSGHLARGFIILDTNENNETVSVIEEANYYNDAKRPLWFVYSGMGSQWPGMGTQLMRIPVFAAAIERCRRVLEPKGIDIIHIITATDKTIFDNILNSFVGIAAIQIGLTDVLTEMKIFPDKIIGHSVGELGCAYADGCLTAEEMILSAYYRGLVSMQTSLITGSMAAIGVGYKEILKMCPPEIDVACHNGPDSSTISGPANIMREFVAQLIAKNIFAKEVPCSNIAYHSRYIADAGPGLLKYLGEVIKTSIPRSKRWVSTSVPSDRWKEPIAKYSSAEYHTNNLLSPVLFEEASRFIQPNAVLVEIAPHGLLQAILKRSLSNTCKHIPLTIRGHPENVQFFLEAIGKLYMQGYNPHVAALYPKVQFPVSLGTPMLSHLVEWVHNEKWSIPMYVSDRKTAAACTNIISVHDDDHLYLKGHMIREKNTYPFAATLVAVWDTLSMFLGIPKKKLSVQFRDVNLHSEPMLHDQRQVRLSVAIHRGTGRFEVLDDDICIAGGFISKLIKTNVSQREEVDLEEVMELKSEDIYQLLNYRNYNYLDEFRSIYEANLSLTKARLLWKNNWVTLIDGLIQINILRHINEGISQPIFISNLQIDVEENLNTKTLQTEDGTLLCAKVSEIGIRCGGVLIDHMKFCNLPSINTKEIVLKTIKHFPDATRNNINNFMEGKDYLSVQENGIQGQQMALEMTRSGDIDSLHWVARAEAVQPGIPVKVHYVGLNDAYVKRVLGVAASEGNKIDMVEYDFSGITDSNVRVMGIVQEESIRSQVKAKPELLWPVPQHWSLEDAATVPLAYCMAFYCLSMKSNLIHGNSILVHGGAGALGQAVISIALAHGCDIYTTVNSVKKKRFLLQLLPGLKDDHIGYSRDGNFVNMVLSGTNGKGCDIVISCLKQNLRNDSIKCCAFDGYIIDTALIMENGNYAFEMYCLCGKITFTNQQFSSVFEPQNVEKLKILQLMMSEGIARGFVRPLTRVVYKPENTVRAVHLQAEHRHIGRVLLNLQEEISYTKTKIVCSPDRLQLILADDEILGVRLADRLISRGAKKFELLCNSSKSQSLLFKQRSWEKQGIQCTISYGSSWDDKTYNLRNNKTLQNVEGIYCIVTCNAECSVSKCVEHLTFMARRSNWCIRYFAVIDARPDVNEVIKLNQPQDRISIIKLPSPKEKENDRNKECLSKNYAIDAIEEAICSAQHMVAAYGRSKPHGNLLEVLAAVTGIPNLAEISQDVTLKDLGMNTSKLQLVQMYLRDEYNIFLEQSTIQLLTIEKIKELQDRLSEKDFTETEDLKTFFSSVEQDELVGTTEMIFLPTLTTCDAENSNEFNVNKAFLCVIPGVEGLHLRFHTLCERLKLPAMVLQPGFERPQETIQELAQRCAQFLLKKAQWKRRFYLLGYESGVLVALEVAAILEQHGLTGTIFCIGGGPEEVQEQFEEKLAKFKTEDSLQVAVARHMFSLLDKDNVNLEHLEDNLINTCTWKQKVSICLQKLLGRIDHSVQYAQQVIDAAYFRIVQVRRYSSKVGVLRSKLVSIRPSSASKNLKSQSLQSYSQQQFVDYELRNPLAFAAQDLRCAAIINRHLDNDILEEFENKNLCETYAVNAYSFLTTGYDVVE